MGASTFKEYLVEAQSEKLRETLKHSLDIFQIIMGIEEEFDIEIDNDEAEKISTVQDAVDQIKKVVE